MIGYSLEDENLTQEIIEEYEKLFISNDNYISNYYHKREIITLLHKNKFIVYVYNFNEELQELYIYDDIFELARDWRGA